MKLLGDCIFRCSINEIWENEKCVCKPGTAKIDSVCRQCPANSVAATDGSKCICDNNYLWNPDRKTCDRVLCGANAYPEYINSEYVCKCNLNAYSKKGVCTLIPLCPKNAIFDIVSEKCICQIEGENLIDGLCKACGQFEFFNGAKCDCIKGYVVGVAGCRPACGKGFEFVGGYCVCKANHIKISSDECVECPIYTKPNAEGTKCDCIEGYLYDKVSQKCVAPNCRENSSPIQTDTGIICTCDKGTYLEDGWCKLYPVCPPNSKWNQKTLACVCQNKGEYLIDNVCRTCAQNEAWNGS